MFYRHHWENISYYYEERTYIKLYVYIYIYQIIMRNRFQMISIMFYIMVFFTQAKANLRSTQPAPAHWRLPRLRWSCLHPLTSAAAAIPSLAAGPQKPPTAHRVGQELGPDQRGMPAGNLGAAFFDDQKLALSWYVMILIWGSPPHFNRWKRKRTNCLWALKQTIETWASSSLSLLPHNLCRRHPWTLGHPPPARRSSGMAGWRLCLLWGQLHFAESAKIAAAHLRPTRGPRSFFRSTSPWHARAVPTGSHPPQSDGCDDLIPSLHHRHLSRHDGMPEGGATHRRIPIF